MRQIPNVVAFFSNIISLCFLALLDCVSTAALLAFSQKGPQLKLTGHRAKRIEICHVRVYGVPLGF